MTTEGLRIDDRRRVILEQLTRTGRVRVQELGRELGVSEVTIRHDLKILEENGLLERVPGGAVATVLHLAQGRYLQQKKTRTEAKQQVAAATAELIADGETLLINSGTTTLLTAIALRRRQRLNILTNSLAVAMELGDFPTFRVILLGGRINTQYAFTSGSDALAQLAQYKADKAILSVDGIDSAGITTYHAEEAEINRAMISRSRQTIIVADSSKLGRESFNNICALQAIGCLVTNRDADPDTLRTVRASGVEVVTA
ncbi:MAG: DeoR/GlpR transcriptional regulator [Clostridiaceae bacterium]|jgi:DeoR/GlpR family transcriptional regulator of sugar metabolism|nr:DeoR/GlpR transcriptional regulator [Clostridiaceae bacterium]